MVGNKVEERALLGDDSLSPRCGPLPDILKITRVLYGDLWINVLTRAVLAAMAKKHKFSLILSGISELTPELADALYEATDGDIELSMCNGVAVVEFTRSAPGLRNAILSAIREIKGAESGIRVVRVESEAANTIAKINAELLGISS